MTERLEQRYCVKFCVKLGDSQARTVHKVQQAFGDEAMSAARIKVWYNRFKDGRTSVESKARSGRPSTSRNEAVVDQVRSLVMQIRRITIRELANETNISVGSVHSILIQDLGFRRIAARFVPKLLTSEQKQLRLEIAQDMLKIVDSDPNFLNTVITGDETWVYGYDPETKLQSSEWRHPTDPRPRTARQARSKVKVMLTVFFDSNSVVHHGYAPHCRTITKGYYQEVLGRLRQAVRRKRPDCGQRATGDSTTTTHPPILHI